MALLTTVLIPLGAALGTLLLDREAEEREKALLVAQHMMTNAVEGDFLTSAVDKAEEGLKVSVRIENGGSTRDILVSVFQGRAPGRVLVKLHKTIVFMQ